MITQQNKKEKISPRTCILGALEAAGTWLSGETLSAQLGISRAAVGKHVSALRNDGHAIEAVTRKGYRLMARRDALGDELKTALSATRLFGQAGWMFLDATTSSNLEAVRRAAEGAAEGLLVVAEHQTKGRGRKGHDWFSAPRSLQFSVLLYPRSQVWDADAFTREGAEAVARTIRELTQLQADVKMPNDVLIRGKKVAGVLVETGYRGNEPEWAVIGIGCNINALPEDFPEHLRYKATSLLMETGHPVARIAFLASLLQKLEAAYEAMHKSQ